MAISNPAWLRDKSNPCVKSDPELFFPPKGAKPVAAMTLCSGCRNIDRCLAFAVDNNITDGVWGGTTRTERRPLVRAAGTGGVKPGPRGPRLVTTQRLCGIRGCERKHDSHDMCGMHYQRSLKEARRR
jgi:WhiB family redox-sensing transcriptional regulator